MKPTITLRTILTWVAILAPFAYLAVLWPQLPARIPTHFNTAGEVNGYGSKYLTLVLAGMPLLAYALRIVGPRLDPKRRLDAGDTNYQKLMLSVAIGLSVISCVLLYATQHRHLPATLLPLALCLLFVLMGNYLTTVKPNYFVGVRTPWTLESKSVWTKTHRLAGRLFFGGGLLGILLLLLLPATWAIWIVLAVALGVTAICYCYSYAIYRQEAQAAASH